VVFSLKTADPDEIHRHNITLRSGERRLVSHCGRIDVRSFDIDINGDIIGAVTVIGVIGLEPLPKPLLVFR